MRLIDADRLLCVIDDDGGWAYDGLEYQAYMSCLRGVLEDIEEAPTIKPESLRPTANWNFGEIDSRDVILNFVCDKCGGLSKEDYPYCPHCGARMMNADE